MWSTILRYSHIRWTGIVIAAGACMAFLLACAGPAQLFATGKSNVLAQADSLFDSGKFNEATAAYQKVCAAIPRSAAARTALIAIAYSNVFYKNPNGNWNAALEAFNLFNTSYPHDNRISEVRSWIRVLSVIKSIDNELELATHQVKRLAQDKNAAQESKRYYLDSIAGILKDATKSRDSLFKKNQDLENTIIDLEKKCQQAVR
jgi:outer membrane protein assembly factor BamD (BamD/ComL family)